MGLLHSSKDAAPTVPLQDFSLSLPLQPQVVTGCVYKVLQKRNHFRGQVNY